MISQETLDKRICDVEPNAVNTETYREFIVHSQKSFGIESLPLENMTDEELKDHLELLDYLWEK